MMLQIWAQVGSRNHVLDGDRDPPVKTAILRGKEGSAYCKIYGSSAVSCAKTDEPIKMPFGKLSWVSIRNHVLDGVQMFSWEGDF